MEQLPDLMVVQAYAELVWLWVVRNVFVWGNLVQALVIGLAFVVAYVSAPKARGLVGRFRAIPSVQRHLGHFCVALEPLTLPFLWLILQWLAVTIAVAGGWPHSLQRGAVSLLTAWVVIRFFSSILGEAFWSRTVAGIIWVIAALNIVGLLGPTMNVLDSIAMDFGEVRISVLGGLKAMMVLAGLLWLSGVAARTLERRLGQIPSVSPSVRVLFGKLFRLALVIIALIAALNSLGIDLTALAVFSGAVGLGVGFGMQKVVSNLVSGIILLIDKSVKPGDVIAIGQTFGWINSLSARYVSVITRDGIEHLIPNEELISQRVENWSYTNMLVRQKIPFGVAYDSDLYLARELAIQAAVDTKRVLADPAPVCHLLGFGDSAVDLELRIWIQDPQNGVQNVKSAVMLRIWDLFHEHGVEFPFPQRDLHIKTIAPVSVAQTVTKAKPRKTKHRTKAGPDTDAAPEPLAATPGELAPRHEEDARALAEKDAKEDAAAAERARAKTDPEKD